MKELEDYNWFPSVLRNFQTEFIGFFAVRMNIYSAFIEYLKTLSLPLQPMADLCSGGGEPAISIFRKSNCFHRLILSDKYPASLKINDKRIEYEMQSKDVTRMEFEHGVCYTMFNAFHHFSDEEKQKIVQKIQASGSVAFLVEILEPDVICFLKVFFATTMGSLLLTPFIRPFSLKRLFFTYVVPVNVFTITFDGMLSVLKSRSVRQYQKLFVNCERGLRVFRMKGGLHSLSVIQIQPEK